MYKTRIDLTGQRFGRLKIIKYSHTDKHKKASWVAVCDCGETKVIKTNSLRSGKTNSCGCLHREQLVGRSMVHGDRYTHLYSRWLSMHRRVSESNQYAKRYFDRGITVCDRWKSYINFKQDMEVGFNEYLSLDRIDNNKGYYKENCRWADAMTQAKNRERTHIVLHNGERFSPREISEMLHTNIDSTRFLVYQGLSYEEIKNKLC